MDRFGKFYLGLNTNISPMVYIMMMVNVVIGFCFGTGLLLEIGTESVLYSSGVLLDKNIWGFCLLGTAGTSMLGFISKKDWLVEIGGILGFCLWLFASISVGLQGHWYILFTVTGFHLLFHGYIYLATRFGLLRRRPLKPL